MIQLVTNQPTTGSIFSDGFESGDTTRSREPLGTTWGARYLNGSALG